MGWERIGKGLYCRSIFRRFKKTGKPQAISSLAAQFSVCCFMFSIRQAVTIRPTSSEVAPARTRVRPWREAKSPWVAPHGCLGDPCAVAPGRCYFCKLWRSHSVLVPAGHFICVVSEWQQYFCSNKCGLKSFIATDIQHNTKESALKNSMNRQLVQKKRASLGVNCISQHHSTLANCDKEFIYEVVGDLFRHKTHALWFRFPRFVFAISQAIKKHLYVPVDRSYSLSSISIAAKLIHSFACLLRGFYYDFPIKYHTSLFQSYSSLLT